MTGFTPELVEQLESEAEVRRAEGDINLAALLLDARRQIERWKAECRLLVDTMERDQQEYASGIAELTEALECAVGIIKDARLLGTESPGLAAFENLLAKIGGNQ